METLLNWLWQGAIVAAVTTAVLPVIGRSRAQTRYWTVWAALVLVLALPLLHLAPASEPAPAPSRTAMLATGEAGPRTAQAVVTIPSDGRTTATLGVVLAVLAGCWTAAHAWRIGLALVALRRARRDSRPFPADVEERLHWWTAARASGRRARLALSADVRAAAVFGGREPVIAVAPSMLSALEATDLDRVVVHEWAHVQRRDDLAHVVQLFVVALAGWHPAVWWLDRQLHAERETSCDEMAVAMTGSPRTYAACLARVASLPPSVARPLPVVAVLARSGLRRRVGRILSRAPEVPARPVWMAVAAATGLLLAVTANVGIVRLVALATVPEPGTGAPASAVLPSREPPAVEPAAGSDPPATATTGALTGPVPDALETPPAGRPSSAAVNALRAEPDARPSLERQEISRTAAAPLAATALPTDNLLEGPPAPVDRTAEALPPVSTGNDPAPGDPAPDAAQSPWDAAADAGVAIGRGSREAAEATAGFFSRFGRSIADSF